MSNPVREQGWQSARGGRNESLGLWYSERWFQLKLQLLPLLGYKESRNNQSRLGGIHDYLI
jgi:hypothetical protein